MHSSKKIVIVGGGAAGLELATLLGNKLGKRSKASIVLVDAASTHLWKPLLHEVAAGTLDSNKDELNYLTHAHVHHFQFQQGKLAGLNREQRKILLAPVYDYEGTEIIPQRELAYDILVLAIGSVTHDFNTPGARENCFFLDSREQADHFQKQLVSHLIKAQYLPKPWPEGLLDIAIIGAGATGVELAAELYHTVQNASSFGLQNIDPNQDVKITLIEAAPRILPALSERLANATQKTLQSFNVNILIGERVVEVNEQGIKMSNGKFIPASLKVWTAGVKAPDFLRDLDGLEVNKVNQLLVKKNLQTTQDEHIFALGDCAACPMENGKWVPPRAQAAHQQASLLAKSLERFLENKPLLNYHYRDYGSLISLGHRATVGSLMGRATKLFIHGKLARLTYLSLYKNHQIKLFGFWRTFFASLADLLTFKTKPRLKLH